MAGTHDLLVNLIGKAISTGKKVTPHSRDNSFFAGRISAFCHSAAMTADLLYSADFDQAKHVIMREVEDVHLSWSTADLRDEGRVGAEATRIAVKVLAA